MLDEPTREKAREAVCRQALDALKPFATLKEEDLENAVALAYMLAVGNREVPKAELAQALRWAHGIQGPAIVLQFFLAGVTELSFSDGQAAHRLVDPAAAIAALVREGIARPE